ncbi:MAG: spondin domain-containing protein [Dongiaceae bacterium]
MRRIVVAGLGAAVMTAFSLGALGATTDGTTTFTIKIVNVSKDDTLQLPGGAAVKAPIAPGVYLVDHMASVFVPGRPATAELQALAEDGNFEPLQHALEAEFGARAGMFAPGLEFTVTAKPGDRLSFATMFVQSNDKFYAPAGGSLALFDANGDPISGDLTTFIRLFDAGTEVDQRPGAGSDQAPRQKTANQGPDQGGVVAEANDGFVYPAVGEVIHLEIEVVR